jgi:hypothetical protein
LIVQPSMQVEESQIARASDLLRTTKKNPSERAKEQATNTKMARQLPIGSMSQWHEISPDVCELIPQSSHWKFTKKMKREFVDNLAGRIWWINTNTKVKTHVDDKCTVHTPKPSGIRVWALGGHQDLQPVIDELKSFFDEERVHPTLPFYNMEPYNKLYIMFTDKNPELEQMSLIKVLRVLRFRAPKVHELAMTMCLSIQAFLQVSWDVLEENSNLGIIRYYPGAGFQTHIDNIVRSNGSVGPVFTLSLGENTTIKYFDMFPVVEHEKFTPVRICTPIGSIILMDGVSRLEWSHGIPEGDPTERWTIMLKFRQISRHIVKFSELLKTNIFESKISG